MSRVLRVTIATILLCSIGIWVTMRAGSAQPSFSDLILDAVQTAPDGSPCAGPCMFGVIPGVTSLDESVKILLNHPFLHAWDICPDDLRSHFFMLEGMTLRLYSFDNQHVSSMYLALDQSDKEHFLTNGDLVARLGAPDSACQVWNYPLSDPHLSAIEHILTYGRAHTITYASAGAVNSHIEAISITTPEYVRVRRCNWYGFRTEHEQSRI